MGPKMTGDPYVHSSRCSLSLSLLHGISCNINSPIFDPVYRPSNGETDTPFHLHPNMGWKGAKKYRGNHSPLPPSPPPHASFHSIPIFIAIQTRPHLLLHQSPAGIQMLQLTNENASYYISILAKHTQHDTTGAAAVAAAATATTGGEKSLVAFCFFQEARLLLLLVGEEEEEEGAQNPIDNQRKETASCQSFLFSFFFLSREGGRGGVGSSGLTQPTPHTHIHMYSL